jgi:2-hydroxychromene-2-carboxylate isomerase
MTEPDHIVEYFFSFISLWSYIGSRAFQQLVARHGLTVVYKPTDLMSVFAATGGLPVKQRSIPRQAYRVLEMQRWRTLRRIPLVLHPRHYPADPSRGHRMLLAAVREGSDVARFAHLALQAVWADELDIADPDTLVRLADAGGLDGRALVGASDDPALEAQAQALTREAIERRVFGAPFYVWRGEPFWGQDRLDLLDAAIRSGRAPIAYGEV